MDRYEKLKHVGKGLFSDVYKGIEKSSAQVVAIKITCPEDEVSPHDSLREVEIVKQLTSLPGSCSDYCTTIIRFLDTFCQQGDELELVMIMPYLPYDLEQILKSRRKAEFPSGWRNGMDPNRSIEIIGAIAKALGFIHSHGVIHRDIKPQNILFKAIDGDPVLCDFGISWKEPDNFGKESSNQKISDVGTTVYRAPELLFGVTNYTSAIDMWSLGCVSCLLMSTTAESLFLPYNGDISLLGSQFKKLGTPTIETWPSMKDSETFCSLLFENHQGEKWTDVCPRGPEWFRNVVSQLLVFEPTFRLTASDMYKTLMHIVGDDKI